jgi:hypothetical protein
MTDKNGTRLKKGDRIAYGGQLGQIHEGIYEGWYKTYHSKGRFYEWIKIKGEGFTTQVIGRSSVLKLK